MEKAYRILPKRIFTPDYFCYSAFELITTRLHQILSCNVELVAHAEYAWLGKSVQGPSLESNTIDVIESLMHDALFARPWETTEAQKDADNTICSTYMGMEFLFLERYGHGV